MTARAQTQKEPLSDAKTNGKLFGALVLTGLLIAPAGTGPLSLAVLPPDFNSLRIHLSRMVSPGRIANPFVLLPLAFTEMDCQCFPCHTGDAANHLELISAHAYIQPHGRRLHQSGIISFLAM